MDGKAGSGDARQGARKVPIDLSHRGLRFAPIEEGCGLSPLLAIHGQQGTVPDDGIAEPFIASRAGGRDRLGHCVVRRQRVSAHETRERQHPQRQIAPATADRFERHPSCSVGQHVVRARAAHRGSEHRTPGLERCSAIRWTNRERPALGDVRESLGGSRVA